jgi:hypothetical protein
MYEMMLLLAAVMVSWWVISTVGGLLGDAWNRRRALRNNKAVRGLARRRRAP